MIKDYIEQNRSDLKYKGLYMLTLNEAILLYLPLNVNGRFRLIYHVGKLVHFNTVLYYQVFINFDISIYNDQTLLQKQI